MVQKERGVRGKKMMNRCKQAKMDTKEYGKMFRRILTFEEVTVPAKCERMENPRARRRVTRKKHQRLEGVFGDGGFMVQQGLWTVAKKRLLEDGRVLPKEDEVSCENIELNMKRTLSAVGCVRMWKEKRWKWKS